MAHELILDGKKVIISDESYQELKRAFQKSDNPNQITDKGLLGPGFFLTEDVSGVSLRYRDSADNIWYILYSTPQGKLIRAKGIPRSVPCLTNAWGEIMGID